MKYITNAICTISKENWMLTGLNSNLSYSLLNISEEDPNSSENDPKNFRVDPKTPKVVQHFLDFVGFCSVCGVIMQGLEK